ncbi:type VI secretion system protein ImpF [[Luteovulum] sphaeroides subsp. megalophilum]|uniref:type VI secretion system baseplate subunit TssE n=1 Tax=Cereibacter sphaeroides TaxID=1063 RepID=UPI000B6D5935|nr:type VI secretion system baseplate subunit TssE [Cereibacter sphaeroides]SNS83611.1 type VI secretion system protein ImpF [[Luteovulum] sphaeroides subsp. megalophilum]
MAETVIPPHARREAVQPSLWDRLREDLPGLIAESGRARAALARELGEERLDELLGRGRAGLAGLDEGQRRAVLRLMALLDRRAFLEEHGLLVTPEALREAVRRDVEALFNTERLQAHLLLGAAERGAAEDPADTLEDFPHVRRSVLNFGVPTFSGRRARDFDPERLARDLREVVALFEPRLRRDTLRIRVDTHDRSGLRISIEGVLMLAPVPERLRLSTMLDLDTGSASTALEEA